MHPGAWSICYQLGSGDYPQNNQWHTCTLLVHAVSTDNPTVESVQTFYGECFNDDRRCAFFVTKVTGSCKGSRIVWEQLVPTQWKCGVETLSFTGSLNFNDRIGAGRINTLSEKGINKNPVGVFRGRRLVYEPDWQPPELPAGIVAGLVAYGCIWYWSLDIKMDRSLMCGMFTVSFCDDDDIQEDINNTSYATSSSSSNMS